MTSAAEIVRTAKRAGITALARSAEHLLATAVNETPLDEGTLRASETVDVTELPNGADATVSANEPYAAIQHERTDFVHRKAGKAHYLSDPLKANAHRYETVIGQAIKRALGT